MVVSKLQVNFSTLRRVIPSFCFVMSPSSCSTVSLWKKSVKAHLDLVMCMYSTGWSKVSYSTSSPQRGRHDMNYQVHVQVLDAAHGGPRDLIVRRHRTNSIDALTGGRAVLTAAGPRHQQRVNCAEARGKTYDKKKHDDKPVP